MGNYIIEKPLDIPPDRIHHEFPHRFYITVDRAMAKFLNDWQKATGKRRVVLLRKCIIAEMARQEREFPGGDAARLKEEYDRAHAIELAKKSGYARLFNEVDIHRFTAALELSLGISFQIYFAKVFIKVTAIMGDPNAEVTWCFVHKFTGDIYRAASAQRPGRKVKGNIARPETYLHYSVRGPETIRDQIRRREGK